MWQTFLQRQRNQDVWYQWEYQTCWNTQKFAQRGLWNEDDGGDFPCIPAPSHHAAVEIKTWSALGQAARGNWTKGNRIFVESMKTVYIKKWYSEVSTTVVWQRKSCQGESTFLVVSLVTIWFAVPRVQAAARQGQTQEEGLNSQHRFSSQVVQKLVALYMQ